MSGLKQMAMGLVPEGKGILAADESERTLARRFGTAGIESTPEARRVYREILFTTPGIEEFISAVILHDETIRQGSSRGVPLPRLLAGVGIIPGIKVDRGTTALPLAYGETITEGLDGLATRLQEYHALGARFAKWRATYPIGAGRPSDYAIRANVQALARYAALCQEAGLVPIVEPEVLMDGGHTISDAAHATERVLHAVFDELYRQRVDPRGLLLKPNMIVPGSHALRKAPTQEVAEITLKVLYRQVPAAVPAIVFLSGGQAEEAATEHLNAMVVLGPHPWRLSFSFSRALQNSALSTWQGQPENTVAAQAAFYRCAMLNGAASLGGYDRNLEGCRVAGSLEEIGHGRRALHRAARGDPAWAALHRRGHAPLVSRMPVLHERGLPGGQAPPG